MKFMSRDGKLPAPKREHKPSGQPLEADVLRAVGELLAVHPKVLFAVRQNSGALPYKDTRGAMIPVWFYKIVRSREKVRISDYWGLLISGRMFAIECKRPSWIEVRNDREREQEAFLRLITLCHGSAGFARSSEEAKRIIEARTG